MKKMLCIMLVVFGLYAAAVAYVLHAGWSPILTWVLIINAALTFPVLLSIGRCWDSEDAVRREELRRGKQPSG